MSEAKYRLIVLIDAKLENPDVEPSPTDSVTLTPRRTNNANLPKLTLKSFSGNPIEFQSFWDNFRVAVHENNDSWIIFDVLEL